MIINPFQKWIYILFIIIYSLIYIYNHLRLKRKLKENINMLKEISKREQVIYFTFCVQNFQDLFSFDWHLPKDNKQIHRVNFLFIN